MSQTASEYVKLITESELDAFGFSGTRMPPHIKGLTFSVSDSLLSEDAKERLEDDACRRIREYRDLPPGIRLTGICIHSLD